LAVGYSNFSDSELAVAAARKRSLLAFEEIVRRYQAPLRQFLGKRFPSRPDNDDILQDTFLKAWQSIHLYNPSLSLRTWLYTITYRTAVSQGRKDKPTKPLSAGLSADAPLPGLSLQQFDEGQSLWKRAREVLTEDQFTALWLHYVDDLPARDIAKILQRSWVSVKTLMHRARKKLEPYVTDAPARGVRSRGKVRPAVVVVKAGEI
jgi:RNA polymerase sigma-70 factor (ECF subfamily)